MGEGGSGLRWRMSGGDCGALSHVCLPKSSFERGFLTCRGIPGDVARRGVLGEVARRRCRFLRLCKGVLGLPVLISPWIWRAQILGRAWPPTWRRSVFWSTFFPQGQRHLIFPAMITRKVCRRGERAREWYDIVSSGINLAVFFT
jgi:hypothetical protein